MSSGGYWDEYSDASECSMERHRDPKHNRRTTAQTREESYAKSLSAQQSEEEEDFVQETPEAALVAAQAYLLTTQPEPGDPWEHMHQAAIRSLGLIEDKLMGKLPEKKATQRKKRQKEEFKCKSSQNESSESSGEERRQKRKEDARNIIAQARVNNSRYAWIEENYEDDEKEMGTLCFTHRVRKMRVPKGFKLPHDQQKYDARTHSMVVRLPASSTDTRRNKNNSHAKFAVTPHRRSTVLVEHPTQRFHRELGRIRESICKKFLFDV
jgi:hypothetical protein